MKKITENSTLKEVLEIEGAEEILKEYNLPCLGCPFAKFEAENLTLKEIARFYGIDLKNLIGALNKKLKK